MPMTVLSPIFLLLIIFIAVPVGCLVLLKIVTQLIDKNDARTHQFDQEEETILQELYSGMEKMETRIEALETILINKNH